VSNSPQANAASIDPAPARALHTDLLARWKSIGGNSATIESKGSLDSADKPEHEKTVEELLADLGPDETWEIHKSEEDQVKGLLQSAQFALANAPQTDEDQRADDTAEDDTTKPARHLTLPAVDVSVFQPEPLSDAEDDVGMNKGKVKESLDTEADELLARILDEVKHFPVEENADKEIVEGGEEPESDHTGNVKEKDSDNLDLPSTPSKLPELPVANTSTDDDLASRFASLSLPSVPTTMKSTKTKATELMDEEIETWCIICSDDATLRCIGCDGDLYCTNCWLEGHTGEDAGMDERRHKAVQYNKGGPKKKNSNGRVAMGA
jgi:hypothetical protein